MTPPLPDPRFSHAVLIGVSEFRRSADLPNLPAVGNNITDLHATLTNSNHGILLRDNCTVVANPESPGELMDHLRQTVRRTDDFLFVYYAGHGVRHATKDELYLTVRHTDTDALNGTAVPLDWVKEEIEASPARTRLLVLDCCYSGLAVGTMSTTLEERDLEVQGSAVIASSPKNAPSHSPVGYRCTAFTSRLVTLLNEGSPNKGEQLTVSTLYSRVSTALVRDGFPRPMLKLTGTTGDLPLRRPLVHPSPSPAPPPPPPPPVIPPPVIRRGQLVLLRFLWFSLALTLAMVLSGLFGVFFAEPRVAGDSSSARAGAYLAAVSGVSLFLLHRRWRHLRRPARSSVRRVWLVVGIGLSLAVCLVALFSYSPSETRSGSVAAGRAALVIIGVESAAACGYHLYRGRRTHS
jgi:hypothetical protein